MPEVKTSSVINLDFEIKRLWSIFLGWINYKTDTSSDSTTIPRHVHLALGCKSLKQISSYFRAFRAYLFQVHANEMVVSWMTRVWTPSQVFYGLHPFSMHKLANGTSFKFIEGNVTRFTHKVTLRDLRPKMIYSKEAGFLLKKIINF